MPKDRIEDAFKRLAGVTWASVPHVPRMRQYIETGTDADIPNLPQFTQGSNFWIGYLADAMETPPRWDDRQRRLVHVLARLGSGGHLRYRLNELLTKEPPDADYYGEFRKEMQRAGYTPQDVAVFTLQYVTYYATSPDGYSHQYDRARGDRPTSAGRYLLEMPGAELLAAVNAADKSEITTTPLAALLSTFAPERITPALADVLLREGRYGPHPEVARLLLAGAKERFEPNVFDLCKAAQRPFTRWAIGQHLYAYDPAKYDAFALAAGLEAIEDSGGNQGQIGKWLIENYKARVVPQMVEFLRRQSLGRYWAEPIMDAAATNLGDQAQQIYLALVGQQDVKVRLAALGRLIGLNDPAHDGRIAEEIRKGLARTDSQEVIPFLQLAGKWKPQLLAEDVWALLAHKSKPVREAAARSLARLGDHAVPRAVELLSAKKADTRLAAVALLEAVGSTDAEAPLEARADAEENDDVRDAILLALQGSRERRGIRPTRADMELRMSKADAKLKNPVAKWLDESALPPLKWHDGGGTLDPTQVRYLLYRQSRVKEMTPDVEAQPLYALLDPASAAEFARAVLQAFLASGQEAGDRWALAVAGILGDDRVVPLFARSIREWVEGNRGKLAEYAVQALALLGTDAALLAVDALAIRYRNKMKNVGRAAAEAFDAAAKKQGITPEELGDRVVPWLGFEPGKPRVIESGKTRIEVSIGPDFKLAFKDLEKNKPIKTPPKSLPPETLTEFKDTAANLREIAKAQHLRLENLLVRQRRWPAARWKELFLRHPLLIPFATRLAWGHYDDAGRLAGTFRALEDLTLTTPTDEEFSLSDTGTVGMLHPLELDEPTRQAWRQHVADYNIEPPFPQMERPVLAVKPQDRDTRLVADFANQELNAMTFRSRAEKRGWARGSVADAGTVSFYIKTFPAAGTDVLLYLDGMFVGIDMYSSIRLQHAYFVKSGSVKIGSYVYDEPANENDPRVIPLGQVNPIAYSEAMADLQQIAGATGTEEAE